MELHKYINFFPVYNVALMHEIAAFHRPVVLGSNLTHFQKVSTSEIWVSFNQIVKKQRTSQVKNK